MSMLLRFCSREDTKRGSVMVWVLCVQERFGEVMGCFLYILL